MDEKYYTISYAESPFGTLNQYMTRTFVWMFAGLLVTFAVGVGTLYSPLVRILFNSGLYLLLCIAELVMVVVLSARIDKLRPSTATSLFFGYAVLNGLNLSVIFAAYAFSTLVLAFLVGALYFGIMALYGSRTQKDLSSWGPMLSGALITLIVVGLLGSLLMFFVPGLISTFDLLLCAVSLVVFMAFTAYDVQKLKYYYSYFGGDAAMLHKSSIIGALSLYLDYINIFLYVLRILGRHRD
ncbi:Bax inhibitor-1/YccA family protein [uncultured Gemmiger sp.]|uniref:Bax inhibitor-1/YccA family protein n=1 Tax=uncultured Gemmiger sp. TaxID=1623490 RepID=UPI0025D496D7|nr:Bax inhibitor-1/YccA family protein [uncultured Gemmiger sp.]